MWMVMMAGMMTASVAPESLLYARVGRQARAEGVVFAATGWLAAGYSPPGPRSPLLPPSHNAALCNLRCSRT
jgi:hypothetical protein